jgi:hypothetical protein
MHAIGQVYDWSDRILRYAFIVAHIWAFVDCAIRKAAAFRAADKLTKPAWLFILLVAGLLGWKIPPAAGVVSLISMVVVAIYLADVRPAVRDMADGH